MNWHIIFPILLTAFFIYRYSKEPLGWNYDIGSDLMKGVWIICILITWIGYGGIFIW